MSLQHAAKHLESRGRHGDDMLVHMSKNEVKGLQALARAHGGSLTINPETGLAEAGFLRSILPAVASAAAVASGNPQLVPYITAAAAAESYNRTGSLAQGALAGYSAYSGGQLGAGMSGAEGLAPNTAAEVTKDQALKEAAKETALKDAATNQLDKSLQINTMSDNLVGQGVDMNAGINYANPSVTTPPPSVDQLQMEKFIGADGGAYNLVPNTTANLSANVNPLTNTALETGTYGPGATNLANTTANTAANTTASGAMDARAAYDPTFKATPYTGPTEASLAPQSTIAKNLDVLKTNLAAHPMYGIGALAPALLERPEKTGLGKTPEDLRVQHLKYHSAYDPATGKNDPNKKQYYENLGYYAAGGPVEQMSNANAVGANTQFPQADMRTAAYATPWQTPISQNVLQGAQDANVDPYTGAPKLATGGIADAHYNLGGYSDGGRLLKGPGDGVSDSIPAVIGRKQPARLADGEFVVPARIVSEIGNGSTEAGARKLYAMMDRVQSARGKTVGKGKVAKNTKADKYLPA